MRLSDQEFSVLDAMARLHNQHGEYLSSALLADTLPGTDATVVDSILDELERKQFVEFDANHCATITDFGTAALKSM
ncbi:hypothetical protein [Amorphus sp. 3PC139-8]|uniref:hypothetical protein n=1 Tax=Amorphus sp. 3PC139-8 TaxID=2735676 RepID=UPI00345D66F2